MSTGQTLRIVSENTEHTLRIASYLGDRLRGGEVLELTSDLGGGKTAFVRGLTKGLHSIDEVRSPSFTISNQYRAENLTLYHFDFYRLQDPGIMRDELLEIINDPQAVVAIEWSDTVKDVLPEKRVQITITPAGETTRQIDFAYDASLAYLIDGLNLIQ